MCKNFYEKKQFLNKYSCNDIIIVENKMNFKKIDMSIDDYFLNPYKFKYIKNDDYIDNFICDSNDLNSLLKTVTSIIMSNSNCNLKLTNTNVNNQKKEDNQEKDANQIFKIITNNKIDELEKYIILNKMYINFQDSDGDTPLHIAVFLCNIKACEILINNGVDMYIKDKWGQLSLHRICFCISDKNIINIINLFNSKKNFINNIFNELDNYGNTPFHLVLKYIIKNISLLFTCPNNNK